MKQLRLTIHVVRGVFPQVPAAMEMKFFGHRWAGLVMALVMACTTAARAADPVAPKPPMGWNSFDAWDSRITEAQFKANVEFMARELKQYGWEYAVVDYIWFNDNPGGWSNPDKRHGHPNLRLDAEGRPLEKLVMDEYGRLLPSVERFPSAAGGRGFKPLADYVHSKGLKFGIHIMRGIPRQAWFENLPVKGAAVRARDIGEPWDTCNWCNNMFGVDTTRPGAQAYYDSLFELYAAWEVDFIKADDMIYRHYHAGEIELIRRAIDRCGRPMVLSLSPGDAPLGRAHHLRTNANMWRVSADFWDKWPALERMFGLLDAWAPFIGPNHWPDADMLPIGRLSIDDRPHGPERLSRFTWNEHRTMMTLWCMARSPLMMGGDLPTSPEKSLDFLKNPEVLAVNQSSRDNRQVFRDELHAIWIATDPATGDRYVALFNLQDDLQDVTFEFEREMLRGRYRVRDLWQRADLGVYERSITRKLGAHDAALFRLSKLVD
jgi:alpha-galactosidase